MKTTELKDIERPHTLVIEIISEAIFITGNFRRSLGPIRLLAYQDALMFERPKIISAYEQAQVRKPRIVRSMDERCIMTIVLRTEGKYRVSIIFRRARGFLSYFSREEFVIVVDGNEFIKAITD